jgi:tRNA threonylcarbamoyladenosine biosynthesis protein TsaB
LLAVETSTLAGGVALLDGERVLGEYLLDVRLTHSERLMPAIDRLLADARWTAASLQGLAVAAGPGSFTGLRIGLSTVKGLAWSLGLAVAAVPTLDALAAGLPYAAHPVCPVLDARRNEVYCSRYRWDGTSMRREWDYLALPPDALAARLDEPTIVLGDGAHLVASHHARLAPPHRRLPSAATVGVLGRLRFETGEVVSATELSAFYLRPSEAELRRRAVPVH